MALNLGNIIKTATTAASSLGSSNAGDFVRTAKQGISAIGQGLLNEAASTVLGYNVSGDPIYDSPYPLGIEWQTDPAYTATLVFTNPETKTLDTVNGYMPETISMSFGADFSSPLESIGEKLSGGGSAAGAVARMFGFKVSSNIFSMLLWSGSGQVDLTLEMRFVAVKDTFTDVVEPIRKLAALVLPQIDSFSNTSGALKLGMVTPPGPVLEYAGSEDVAEVLGESIGIISSAGSDLFSMGVSTVNSVRTGDSTAVQGLVASGSSAVSTFGGAFNELLKNVRVKNNISLMLGEFCLLRSIVVKDVSPAYNIKCDADGNWMDATVSVQVSTFITPTNADINDMIGFSNTSPSNMGTTDLTSVSSILGESFLGDIGLKLPTSVTDLAKTALGVNIEPQTSVGQLYESWSSDVTKVGKDAGLSTMVVRMPKSSNNTSYGLGMSADEINIFNNNILMG